MPKTAAHEEDFSSDAPEFNSTNSPNNSKLKSSKEIVNIDCNNQLIALYENIVQKKEKLKIKFKSVGDVIEAEDGSLYCREGNKFFRMVEIDENDPFAGDGDSIEIADEPLSAIGDDASVGAMFRRARQQLDLSTRAGAKKAGVDISNLARVEKGAVSPRLETLRKFSQALGFKVKSSLIPD